MSDGLVAANGKDIFRGRFGHLDGMSASEVFDDVVHRVFNADATGVLHVENLAGVDGEIALRVGTSDVPFGVINVGDDAALTKLCEDEPGIDADRREFAGSLFQGINDDSSAINLLIGSKKFTEGWNSWRVSTMGLLNVGRSEGSQIIQLFGRGVRLRGFEGCLKRSSVLDPGIGVPEQVRVLETLGIFGVNADYMETFRAFLKRKGSTPTLKKYSFPFVSTWEPATPYARGPRGSRRREHSWRLRLPNESPHRHAQASE